MSINPYIDGIDTLEAIEAAIIDAARAANAEHKIEIEVNLRNDRYFISRPFTLDAKAHPSLAYTNIKIRANEGSHPVIDSLTEIDASDFVRVSDGIYKYQFKKDENGKYPVFRQLCCNGKRLPLAKGDIFIHPFGLPNRQNYADPVNEKCLYLEYGEVKKILDYGDITSAELTMFLEWEWCNAHIGSIDLDDVRESGGKKYVRATLAGEEHSRFILRQHDCIDIADREFFFTNHPALLTPNTHTYNCKTGELYYALPEGEKIEDKKLSYPLTEQLFCFSGLRGVEIEGLTFSGTTSKYICENMYYARQSNKEKCVGVLFPHAAIVTDDIENFFINDCTFSDLGGNGLLMRDNSSHVSITNSRFYDIAMSAIVIGNHTTEWENPKNRNIDISITNNHLRNIGYDYPAAGGIYLSMVDTLKILHNTIEETAYSGITVGWGWDAVSYALGEKINVRDAEIAYNKIIDFMQLMRDGAAIYVLGANCSWEHTAPFNFMHDNYAEREMYKDNSKRGYYMDGSSTNWEVYDNVILGVRLPIFSQFHVPVQYTHNNYIHDVYTDFPIDSGNHAPERNTIVRDCYYVSEGKDAMLATHPKARSIFEHAGCNLDN